MSSERRRIGNPGGLPLIDLKLQRPARGDEHDRGAFASSLNAHTAQKPGVTPRSGAGGGTLHCVWTDALRGSNSDGPPPRQCADSRSEPRPSGGGKVCHVVRGFRHAGVVGVSRHARSWELRLDTRTESRVLVLGGRSTGLGAAGTLGTSDLLGEVDNVGRRRRGERRARLGGPAERSLLGGG